MDYSVIATGNHEFWIRCAEHHPADAVMELSIWIDMSQFKFVIPSEVKRSRGIYALNEHLRYNRCEDPSTRFARSG